MKKLIFTATAAAMLLLMNVETATAQHYGDDKKAKKEMKKKKHTCNSICTADMHALKHGEKGHKCTDVCHKK